MLGLPPLERRIVLSLLRMGAVQETVLAQALNVDEAALRATLTALTAQQRIRRSNDGTVELVLGRTRRRTLPARLLPALQTSNRLYSTQEIVALRTIVPIMQFARAKLGEYTDHGPGHILRVKLFATQLGALLGLSVAEQHLLRAAALFHDVGNVVERAQHHIISQETVEKLTALGKLPFSAREAALIGLLCRWHRKEYEPNRVDLLQDERVRTGLLASILRIADALDSDYRRFDYSERVMQIIAFFYPHEIYYWQGLNEVLGIRIRCAPDLQIQIFLQEQVNAAENYHVAALIKDVASTPLVCTVAVTHCPAQEPFPGRRVPLPNNNALLVALCDPHSLVMAALSRQQLVAAGYEVELLIYPDSDGAAAWLWHEALADYTPKDYAQLVVIGDRADAALNSTILALLTQWQQVGVTCTILNRHEANWARLPALLEIGVHVNLGGDWAYFWGEQTSERELYWGRIAALCTRDPFQSTVGLAAEDEQLTQGVRKAVYDLARQAPPDVADWATLTLPLLERIAADDRAWFAAQADEFIATYALPAAMARREGQVLQFELSAEQETNAIFWGLEQAIEQQGRKAERGLCFHTPYALATWSTVENTSGMSTPFVELLAINHWREEEAIPIRLLYPTELGPLPEGNESAIRVRLPAAQAAQIIQTLVDACNRQ